MDNNLYGKTRKRLELNDFVLTETVYPSQTILPRHSHSKAYFCFVLQGVFDERYENRSRACRPSSVIFHPSGDFHSDKFGKNEGRCFNFQVENSWLEHIRNYSFVLDSPLEFYGGKLAQLFARLYKEFCYVDAVSPLAIESLSLEIAVSAFRQSQSSRRGQIPSWLKTAKEMLHDNFSEQLSLNLIAGLTGVHPVHLARAFRVHYGSSIGEYVRNLRIKHASLALSSTEKSISEIAYECGFSSQSHFSTAFKRVTNFTPAGYRAIFRKC
jgi:AraC family transcriptional regulator